MPRELREARWGIVIAVLACVGAGVVTFRVLQAFVRSRGDRLGEMPWSALGTFSNRG